MEIKEINQKNKSKWNIVTTYQSHDSVISELLKYRGIENVSEFLNPPQLSKYFNEMSLEFKRSLKDASDLIKEWISNELPIIIYGDYDSDGINATAILYLTIKKDLGYKNVTYFIPNRFDHGYGLSNFGIDTALEKCYTDLGIETSSDSKVLFITVDTGITAYEPINYLKSLNHKVILSDHHQKPDILPKPDILVWNDKIVGAGVSWFISRSLGSKNSQYLSMVALATVTDLYPVIGINRSLIKSGLEVLNTNPPIGIKKLLESSGKGKYEISTYDLGWVIGPRINATGRIMDASESLKLFLSDSEEEVSNIALKLNQINIERQDKTMEMYKIALDNVSDLPKIIFSSSSEYHEGIIGLVAAKLVQTYYRPSIVISLSDGYGKGSVRSIDGVNIIEYLRKFDDLFEELGGHPMAAGFSIKKENIPLLEQRMLEIADEEVPDELLTPTLNIDISIPLEKVDLELINQIEKLKPYGLGNSEPLFISKEVGVSDVSFVGKESQHMSLRLYQNGRYYKGIMFNVSEDYKNLKLGDKIDIVYTLSRNEFNGRVDVNLIIKDLRILNN